MKDHAPLSIVEIMDMFPDDETAGKWFVDSHWPDGICRCKCGSDGSIRGEWERWKLWGQWSGGWMGSG